MSFKEYMPTLGLIAIILSTKRSFGFRSQYNDSEDMFWSGFRGLYLATLISCQFKIRSGGEIEANSNISNIH